MGEWYDRICTFENLFRAYKLAARSKRCKREVVEFELNLAENLWSLHNELESGRYRASGYHRFMVFDPKRGRYRRYHFVTALYKEAFVIMLCAPILKTDLSMTVPPVV